MRNAIALAAHPANMDASAVAVQDVRIGNSIGTVFKVTNGYVPAFRGMTAPGYAPDADAAVEWIEAFEMTERVAAVRVASLDMEAAR